MSRSFLLFATCLPTWHTQNASLHVFRRSSPVLPGLAVILAAALFLAPRSPAQNVKIENCNTNNPNHILPAGTQETDLQITAGITCVVDGSVGTGPMKGVYVYRNVNIWNGALTFNDARIDFHAHSILVEMKGALDAGAISPLKGPLTIWLWGAKGDKIPSITCKSDDKNQCGLSNDVWTSNSNVVMKAMPTMPCKAASKVGYKLPNDDCFYQYEVRDKDDMPGAYFGRKVLAVSAGGSLLLRGAKGIRPGTIEKDPADSGTSWARLTKTLNGDEASLYIDRAVPTWAKGDHIVVTTTDYLPGHTEEFVIKATAKEGTGTRIDIDESAPPPMNEVHFPHWGTTYDYSAIQEDHTDAGPAMDPNVKNLPEGQIETRAIVALLSRSIRVASEGATPELSRSVDHFPQKPGSFYGGQTVVREGFASYQVQGVQFYQLGQGGAFGRYPIHFHMARSVPQPNAAIMFLGTYVADCSVVDSMTRFITVHATQGVTLARNVGYKSIGHGFYLEDATEINNRLYSNVGISVRGALADKDTNPRLVPGILDLSSSKLPYPPKPPPPVFKPGDQMPDFPPFNTDVTTPSVFWIMNTWNDFEYNAAVGAGSCGACYWLPPAGISGSSQYETWKGYAGMQKVPGLYGAVPLMSFKGNSCSAAMGAFITVGATNVCNGVAYGPGTSDGTKLVSVVNPESEAVPAYPVEGGQREKATICDAAHQDDCSKMPPCTGMGPSEAGCAATVIDHFTTSFNWAPTNFAAIWLRGWWYLLDNSAVTDVQNGGVTFITGGGYSRADAAQGYWSVLKNSILVGNTQPNGSDGFPANVFASNAGPFTPKGLDCTYNPSHCVSLADGITFVASNFAVNQRLFNIYDGPSSEYNTIYSDVHTTTLGTLADCKPGGNGSPGNCVTQGYMNAYVPGVLQSPPTNKAANNCILPNAAIAWKQPNGFYYPPAFNSDNLVFHDVDIRHFVIQPSYFPGTLTEDQTAMKKTYCTWQPGMFSDSFTDIDRETELTDNDGSLTGLTAHNKETEDLSGAPTISVTKDPFFNVPLVTDECASGQPPPVTSNGAGATASTSPYEYLTTAVVARCALPGQKPAECGNNWINSCTTPACYGVPLYRQSLTMAELKAFQKDKTVRPTIRMMGQASAQRSTLTLNHAQYYIDTTVSADAQRKAGAPLVSGFLPNEAYDIFFVFATDSTKQSYSVYIGTDLTETAARAAFVPGRMKIPNNSFPFTRKPDGTWATFGGYVKATGLLTVNVDLAGQADLMKENRGDFCQPTTYCKWNKTTSTCGCKAGSTCTDDQVCSYGTKDLDCPVDGCYGFEITLPDSFVAEPQAKLPPTPIRFDAADSYFKAGTVTFKTANETIAGDCHYSPVPKQ